MAELKACYGCSRKTYDPIIGKYCSTCWERMDAGTKEAELKQLDSNTFYNLGETRCELPNTREPTELEKLHKDVDTLLELKAQSRAIVGNIHEFKLKVQALEKAKEEIDARIKGLKERVGGVLA